MYKVSLTCWFIVYLLLRELLCHIDLCNISEHPPHGDGPVWFSLHGFSPDLWPLTLTYGISWAADATMVQASDLFLENVRTDPPRGSGQGAETWWFRCSREGGWSRNTLLFCKGATALVSLLFRCVWSVCWRLSLVTDWCGGDVKWNAPWSQVKVQPLPQPPDLLMSSEVIEFNIQRTCFYGWNVSVLKWSYAI